MTRRTLMLGPASLGLSPMMRAAARRRPRVACILNVYFPNSHADVFMSRLLDGYRLDGKWNAPRVDVVSLYIDQFPVNDMAPRRAREHGSHNHPSLAAGGP